MNVYLKNLNRIEVLETLACTGRCRHCSEGDHAGYTAHVNGEIAARAVSEIAGAYRIESLMIFGGEPLLFPSDVCRILKAGQDAGIGQREIITNGYFSKDEGRIRDVAQMLAQSGLLYILLSVDAFHQETIPLEPVLCFAKYAMDAGIRTALSPAWLVSETDGNPYNVRTREILAQFTSLGFGMAQGNVIWPEGNARIYLKEYFDESKEYVNPYEDDPEDLRAVSIESDGTLLQGNVYRENALDILENYKP